MTTEAATAPGAKTEVVTFRLASEKSKFTVQAFAEGLFSAFGHDPVILIREFKGEVQFVPGTFENASLHMTVDPNSLSVTNDAKEKDRLEIERTMHEEVLETARYPEIVFHSNNISVNKTGEGRCRVRIVGDLTLRGKMQKNVWISAEATLSDDKLEAQGGFSLKQTDFGIKPYSAAGGTIKLKNELKFTFDIVAEKK